MISILFKFAEVLWPRIWSILVYVPHTLENKVYSAVPDSVCKCSNWILLVDAGVEV